VVSYDVAAHDGNDTVPFCPWHSRLCRTLTSSRFRGTNLSPRGIGVQDRRQGHAADCIRQGRVLGLRRLGTGVPRSVKLCRPDQPADVVGEYEGVVLVGEGCVSQQFGPIEGLTGIDVWANIVNVDDNCPTAGRVSLQLGDLPVEASLAFLLASRDAGIEHHWRAKTNDVVSVANKPPRLFGGPIWGRHG